jgi:hypothetical protein
MLFDKEDRPPPPSLPPKAAPSFITFPRGPKCSLGYALAW